DRIGSFGIQDNTHRMRRMAVRWRNLPWQEHLIGADQGFDSCEIVVREGVTQNEIAALRKRHVNQGSGRRQRVLHLFVVPMHGYKIGTRLFPENWPVTRHSARGDIEALR